MTVRDWENDFSSLGNEPLHGCVYKPRVLHFIGFLLELKLMILKVFSNTSVISIVIDASWHTFISLDLDDPYADIFTLWRCLKTLLLNCQPLYFTFTSISKMYFWLGWFHSPSTSHVILSSAGKKRISRPFTFVVQEWRCLLNSTARLDKALTSQNFDHICSMFPPSTSKKQLIHHIISIF